jgi:hypothetical protein
MDGQLTRAVEVAVQKAGEGSLAGLKLVTRPDEEEEVQSFVTEFNEEARAFNVREECGSSRRDVVMSMTPFKEGLLARLPSREKAAFLGEWKEKVELLVGGGSRQ